MKIGSGRAFARVVALLFVVLVASPADAYVDDLRVIPAHPVAGRPVVLAARAGQCHSFTADVPRRLERNGSNLRVFAEGAMAGSGACIAPEHQFRFDMGALEAGSYEVTLVFEDLYFMEQTVEFGPVQFAVDSPNTIPAQSPVSSLFLLIALGIGALAALRAWRGTPATSVRADPDCSRHPAAARALCIRWTPLRSLGVLVALSVPSMASAYVGNVRISPAQPMAGRPILVVASVGGCQAFLDDIDAFREVKRTGSRIDVSIEGTSFIGGCEDLPVYDRQFPIGALPPGSYELHFYFLDGSDSTEVGSLQFVVSKPATIPATGLASTLTAALGILLIAFVSRRIASLAILVFVVISTATPHAVRAEDKEFYVLLKVAPDAITAEDLVEGYDFASGQPPPLAALNAQPALGASYLLPLRAIGHFAQYLASQPDSARARLERYVVLHYAAQVDSSAAYAALQADPAIEYAATVQEIAADVPSGGFAAAKAASTIWRDRTNVDSARAKAGGWALVAALDNGAAVDHDDLRAFSDTGAYVGGNLLLALSADAGRVGYISCVLSNTCIEPNVDKMEPLPVMPGSLCDSDEDGWAIPAGAGHGTHVAGLIAANPDNPGLVRGACRHCGIAAWRVAKNVCEVSKLYPRPSVKGIDAALTHVADLGAQAVNQSFGRALADQSFCANNITHPACLALDYATKLDVLMVAAVGNDRAPIDFPASPPAVLAAGGADDDGALWDRSPGSTVQCPSGMMIAGAECGSNYTINAATDRHQEILAPADSVYSIFYPGMTWNASTGCSDSADGVPDDGAGICTGTSMSSPIISGIAGVLRSINPLVPVGEPDNPLAKPGIRSLLRGTTLESKFAKPWDALLGFGSVDAQAAAQAMLGTVRGGAVRNRAIPLFTLHSSEARDHAAVATPQFAVSIGMAQAAAWSTRGASVAGYSAFPGATPPADLVPKATAFVLSTEFRSRASQPALQPLFLLDRPRPWPAGCAPGGGTCAASHNDHLLVSTIADVEQAHSDGYRLLGRQGYVFARCAPEPACMPAGSAKLYRQCKLADDDCAVFIESEKAGFEANGYTATYPSSSSPVLGYAFPNVDTDGDQLVDGFERMIGTNPASPDSDGDGFVDGAEYPLAGVPVSDPCSGSANTCDPPSFFDGFE